MFANLGEIIIIVSGQCISTNSFVLTHDTYVLTDAYSPQSLYYFCILQPVSSAKCGNNMEMSKLCMHYSSHVSTVPMGHNRSGLVKLDDKSTGS